MPPENQNEPKLKKVENVSYLDTADEKILNVKNPDSHEGREDVQVWDVQVREAACQEH